MKSISKVPCFICKRDIDISTMYSHLVYCERNYYPKSKDYSKSASPTKDSRPGDREFYLEKPEGEPVFFYPVISDDLEEEEKQLIPSVDSDSRPEIELDFEEIDLEYRCPSCTAMHKITEMAEHKVKCPNKICPYCNCYYPKEFFKQHKSQCPNKTLSGSIFGRVFNNFPSFKMPSFMRGRSSYSDKEEKEIQPPEPKRPLKLEAAIKSPEQKQDMKPKEEEDVVSDFLSHQRLMMDQTNRLVFRNFSLERIYWLFGHMMRLGSKAITRKGLTQNEIKKMPSKKVNLNFIIEGELDQCRICICPYEIEEEIRELPCKHNFHSTCIDIWLVQNSFCPLCRKKLRT